jgi:2-(1,2-epoxy-1,2-dihydrophenyl)acetyl-CoA isomerase
MNMIHKAIADDEFDAHVSKLSNTLAQMPTKGLGLTKKALNASFTNSLTQQLSIEETLQSQAGKTYDFKEGTAAFLEKRKPVFIGK